jgi:putative DNA primase/helicase
VACVETEEGRRMAEALVKEMTGGDRMRARRMREDFWEFAPTHHVWLAGNHKPIITGTDHGIWRRIKLIPFEVVIPEDEQDKQLKDKLAEELPGILNWAVAGCLDWQCNGMREPAIVQTATSGYSTEMDDVGEFIAQHCEEGPNLMAPATELYQGFVEATGSRLSQRLFGSRLRERGYDSGRITAGVNKSKHGWKGLRLLSDAAREEQAERLRQSLEAVKAKRAKAATAQ